MKTQLEKGFNVRVYGILTMQDRVLLSEEEHVGQKLLKFPGGGLEFSESPEDGLIREFKEEAKIDIKVDELFYVSKNFHKSYFKPIQMISLYWQVNMAESQKKMFLGNSKPVFLDDKKEHWERLHWRDLKTLQVKEFTTELDREVAEKLLRTNG